MRAGQRVDPQTLAVHAASLPKAATSIVASRRMSPTSLLAPSLAHCDCSLRARPARGGQLSGPLPIGGENAAETALGGECAMPHHPQESDGKDSGTPDSASGGSSSVQCRRHGIGDGIELCPALDS